MVDFPVPQHKIEQVIRSLSDSFDQHSSANHFDNPDLEMLQDHIALQPVKFKWNFCFVLNKCSGF